MLPSHLWDGSFFVVKRRKAADDFIQMLTLFEFQTREIDRKSRDML